MSDPTNQPTVSALVAAYNAESFIAETIDSILSQTRPPDEVIVVDDGSTDGTAAVLEGFGEAIRIVTRANGGCPAAFNTAFAEAKGDFLAMCGADDVWEPRKLEWQLETLRAHPEVDVSIGGAAIFGQVEDRFPEPGRGVLDRQALLDTLYPYNIVCASSVLIRRSLCEQIGPFVERLSADEFGDWMSSLGVGDAWDCEEFGPFVDRFSADDYDYWMRALEAGAVFHYEPRTLVRYRRHDKNVTNDTIWGYRSCLEVHRWHAHQVAPSLVRSVRAMDLFRLGRYLVDAGHPSQGRTAFAASLRQRFMPRALGWTLVLSLPDRSRARAGSAAVSLKRSFQGVRRPRPSP